MSRSLEICVLNLIYATIKFNINRSVDKTVNFLDSLITRKSLKLVDDISNQFHQQY